MKQFLFTFITDKSQWEEKIDAEGMMDASRKVKERLRQYGNQTVQVKYKGIYYPSRAIG
ncbi:hypothetical protein [Aureibacillus halotolerans]|uniref:Uncharacterized protein n=1 Tax=Aureibacillus halotolerans TaxID=1508390 RepID=A0A4R6TX44_9BACI|nr:hypothetical protein [Aureibacillus halotolerans]TDQ36425.1 hypothetical protein EV213_11855 [Aureibacillus halotolerans]